MERMLRNVRNATHDFPGRNGCNPVVQLPQTKRLGITQNNGSHQGFDAHQGAVAQLVRAGDS